jgi:hypothetical protein
MCDVEAASKSRRASTRAARVEGGLNDFSAAFRPLGAGR